MSDIAPDKTCFSAEKCSYFSYISMKTYVVGTHWKRLSEALPMSTHIICFHGEIRKNIIPMRPLLRSYGLNVCGKYSKSFSC